MKREEFVRLRKTLGKTQKEMAQLLGKSIKAIHSYEQGWRSIPPDAERMALFLVSRICGDQRDRRDCWQILDCPPERRKRCPAWEFHAGGMCWFINGTVCAGKARKSWEEKAAICRQCDVFKQHF